MYQQMCVKSIREMPRINYLSIFLLSLFLTTFATSYVYSSSENIDSLHYVRMKTGLTATNSLVNILSGRNLPTSHNLTPLNLTSGGIKVGSEPRNLAINPITNTIYVANYLSDTISVLDGNNGDKVISNIKVGKSPAGLAVDLTRNLLYVSNERLNTVSVIDGRTNQVKSNFTVGLSPTSIGINPVTNTIYVISSLTHSISVVDGATYVLLKMLTVGKSPTSIGINPVTNTIYVTNKDSNTTTVVDGRSNHVITNIHVGHSPYSVDVNPKTNEIFVTNRGFPADGVITTVTDSMSVSVINGYTNEVIKTISVGNSPEGIAVNPITNTIYVANSGSYSISILNGSDNGSKALDKVNLVTKNFTELPQIYNLATYLAVNPKTNKLYITSEDADVVSVLNINTSVIDNFGSHNINQNKILLTGEITPNQIRQPGTTLPGIIVGKSPHGVAVNPISDRIYVTNQESDSISIIDGKTQRIVANNIHVGTFPHVVVTNPITNKVYVTNWGTIDTNSCTVSVLDGRTDKLIADIPTGNSPHSVTVNPNTNRVFVTNEDDNTISVIDGNTDKVLKTVRVGNSPADIVIDEATNMIYVANQDDDTVSVINGSKDRGTVVAAIPSGSQPHGNAFNPHTNKLYISNVGSNTITVVNATTNKIIDRITIGDPNLADDFDFASHIAVNPNYNLIYVTSQDANAITVIDGNTDRILGWSNF